LQSCGADLLAAWPLLLSVLWRAATLPALAALLPLGFRSVQLIASDFLSVLPPACLLAYVEVASVYATQRKHLNVSLTAIGLQWTIGDFLKASFRQPIDKEEAQVLERAEQQAEAAAAAATEAEASEEEEALQQRRAAAPRFAALDVTAGVSAHELWCVSLRQLRVLCLDERPEVRTCSMHSLTSVLTAHGASLCESTWDYALFRTLLPLVSELTHAAASASTTENAAEHLGTEGGRLVLMLLPHSRNTASKQWDKTVGADA
jgi:hypothetical protein